MDITVKGHCIQQPSDIPKVKTDRGHRSVYQSASTLEKIMLKLWTKSNRQKKFEKQLKRITFTLNSEKMKIVNIKFIESSPEYNFRKFFEFLSGSNTFEMSDLVKIVTNMLVKIEDKTHNY